MTHFPTLTALLVAAVSFAAPLTNAMAGDAPAKLVSGLLKSAVNVFYWVDGPFGSALASDADRSVLARVSTEVYQQLGSPR